MLVRLARQTLMERLGKQIPQTEIDSLNSALKDSCFKSLCGTFVTLKIKERLRGCIGNLTSDTPLESGIRRNAISAAFNDPRFAPLSISELDQVEIEISILSQPQPLKYSDGDDLIQKLRPHIDGVIIRKDHASAQAGYGHRQRMLSVVFYRVGVHDAMAGGEHFADCKNDTKP